MCNASGGLGNPTYVRSHTPVEHPSPESHEKTRHHVILNQSTQRSAIFRDQVLVVCGNCGEKGEGKGGETGGKEENRRAQ